MERRMLSKEDEASTDDVEVRREDQERINRFSRLHSREAIIEGELKQRQKDKEDLEEVANELELADEDEKVPYKIGDSFFSLPLETAQEMLATSSSRIDDEVSGLEDRLGKLRDEMGELKGKLYERFGRSINLET